MIPLDWQHATTDVPDKGLSIERKASPEECEAVRAALGILACSAITARYRIKAGAGGIYHLAGSFTADVAQECIVSLEPVAERVTGTLEIEYAEGAATAGGNGGDPLAGVDCEPIVNGVLEVGRVVFEEITAGLDPYPRAEGSTFEWTDPSAATTAEKPDSPFAKLAALKKPSE